MIRKDELFVNHDTVNGYSENKKGGELTPSVFKTINSITKEDIKNVKEKHRLSLRNNELIFYKLVDEGYLEQIIPINCANKYSFPPIVKKGQILYDMGDNIVYISEEVIDLIHNDVNNYILKGILKEISSKYTFFIEEAYNEL